MAAVDFTSEDKATKQLESASSAHSFDSLLAYLRELSDSKRLQGNLFEELVRTYLLNDALMSRQFKDVYLWREWPGNNGAPDTGIDLVAIPIENPDQPVAVQCKFLRLGRHLQKSDVDSFLSESGKEPFGSRLLVETTGVPWSDNAERAIENQSKPVQRIGLTDLRNSSINWASYDIQDPSKEVKSKAPKTLRDHQVRAISDVWNSFDDVDRGVLVMACGTGKTFTSLKLAERFVEKGEGKARVLFLVPSLALMSQTLEEWSAECSMPFHAWSVCSDSKVNRKKVTNQDIADLAVTDLKLPPTTDAQKLADSLRKAEFEEGLQVVFATYQSIDVISEAQQLERSDFDLIICDEAHRTTGATLSGEDESHFVKVHDNDFIRAGKRLYMTATPKLFRPEVKAKATENDAVLASMDDESIFGPVLHRLGFGEAVGLGLLTDYKVVVLAVPEEQISTLYQQTTADGSELNLNETAKLVGMWNALAKRRQGVTDTSYGVDLTPMRRAVVFAKDIKTSKWVSSEFPSLVKSDLQDLLNADLTDDLGVECRHVDGGMNAVVRGEALDWLKEDTTGEETPVCRILTNARCLTEGVDVPTLDAVMFLNPRKSQVDVIQAVGRVMRKAEGKEFGYVILPVVLPAGVTPEAALNDNDRYKVIWQVLQAIRAHDERFEAQINAINYNDGDPTSIIVDVVDFTKREPAVVDPFSGDTDDFPEGDEEKPSSQNSLHEVQTALNFSAVDWKDAVYAKIVKKVGDRMYWDDWSKDIGDIAKRFVALIESLLDEPAHQDDFNLFLESLQKTLNPQVSSADAVEMLAQHIITKPLFDAMFAEYEFTEHNPVSVAMQGILNRLADNEVFEKERQPLEAFYTSMIAKIQQITSMRGKQEILVTLYDKFFAKAFPKLVDKLGIVYTPVEVVDYILQSAESMLKIHFGKSMGDPGVNLIEPFLGTGTFVTRLLQSGIIKPDQLQHKYKHEIFANEIVLLSYYIASINIEAVYREICKENGILDDDAEFPGIVLADTFQNTEDAQRGDITGAFATNLERIERQRNANIQVVMMNPPYSAGQKNANDGNQNNRYPWLFNRIATTYAAQSSQTNKNSLYDSYFLALRWASDRIKDEGIIAFVSNSSFIDGAAAEGVRKSWQTEFSEIYVFNLKGNQRTSGERSRQEGGKIFGSGSRTGVAITVLIKKKNHQGDANIYYLEIDDYLSRQEKLEEIKRQGRIKKSAFTQITPNEHSDWITERDEEFATYQLIGTKAKVKDPSRAPIFQVYSSGVKTNRDAWCWNFSEEAVGQNISRMISNFNLDLDNQIKFENRNQDSTRLSWGGNLDTQYKKGKRLLFDQSRVRAGLYRPFCKGTIYYSRDVNERFYQIPRIFPGNTIRNLAFGFHSDPNKDFNHFITDTIPDLNVMTASQWFSLFTWEPDFSTEEPDLFSALAEVKSTEVGSTSASKHFDFSRPISDQIPLYMDGYKRVDNISDATLLRYQEHYADTQISKEDIFFYIYALLHHPEYRERFEGDLRKGLPRIPLCTDFWDYVQIGRELADLHVNYESVEPYPLSIEFAANAPTDEWDLFQVKKMEWAKLGKQKDFSKLVYNPFITISGLPVEVNEYKVSGRSPLEWLIDRYQVKVDKASGILNDPNAYFREVNNPRYLFDLIQSLITVSIRTQHLISSLPPFNPEK